MTHPDLCHQVFQPTTQLPHRSLWRLKSFNPRLNFYTVASGVPCLTPFPPLASELHEWGLPLAAPQRVNHTSGVSHFVSPQDYREVGFPTSYISYDCTIGVSHLVLSCPATADTKGPGTRPIFICPCQHTARGSAILCLLLIPMSREHYSQSAEQR